MEPLLIGLREAGREVLNLLSMPYFYIAVLLVWWQAVQGVKLQRKLYHVRLRGSLPVTLMRLGAGVLVGVAISAAGFAVGSALSPETLLCVWAAMIVLALFRMRYLCLAYAAGILGIVQAVLEWTVPAGSAEGIAAAGVVLDAIRGINVPGLIFLAGLLHVAEGLLVRMQGAQTAIPLFLEGKRGKPIGAYALSGAWPVPLLWLVPASGGDGFALPWVPLFGLGGSASAAASWTLIAFPVVIGFSDRTETFWPEQKAKASGNSLMIYGVAIAALAAGAVFWPPLAVAAAVAAFVLHEGLLRLSRAREAGRQPLYVQDGSGVRILAVLPGTPAAEMGLEAGETIRKVNGASVRTKEELHAALQRQAAFSKLEVANRDGHVKFVQRARYAGEHHQLGLVLAPDDEADFVAAPRTDSLWGILRGAGARRRGSAAAAYAQAESVAAASEQAAAEQAAAEQAGAAQAVKGLADAGQGAAGQAADGPSALGDAAATLGSAGSPPGGPANGGKPQEEPGLPPRRSKRMK